MTLKAQRASLLFAGHEPGARYPRVQLERTSMIVAVSRRLAWRRQRNFMISSRRIRHLKSEFGFLGATDPDDHRTLIGNFKRLRRRFRECGAGWIGGLRLRGLVAAVGQQAELVGGRCTVAALPRHPAGRRLLAKETRSGRRIAADHRRCRRPSRVARTTTPMPRTRSANGSRFGHLGMRDGDFSRSRRSRRRSLWACQIAAVVLSSGTPESVSS